MKQKIASLVRLDIVPKRRNRFRFLALFFFFYSGSGTLFWKVQDETQERSGA